MVALDTLPDILLSELVAAFPERRVLGIWLYRSHARGDSRPDSDIDLGMLCDEPLDAVRPDASADGAF